jgi:hypothetical protein
LATFIHPVAFAAEDPPADAKDYEVKLLRPLKVGTKYSVRAEGASLHHTTVRATGEAARTSETGYGIRLEGTVEVLEVSDEGEEAKVACTVKRCVRITPDGEEVLVPEGGVVTAVADKSDTTFSVDRGELSDEAKEALELVLQLPDKDGHSDDDVIGTAERQKVGASWPVKSAAVVEDAKDEGVAVEEKDVTGSMKLVGVEQAGGVECLKLAGTLQMKKFSVSDPGELPPGFKVEDGSMEARYSGLFPVDTSLPSVSESMSITQTSVTKGAAGEGDARREITVESRVQRAAEMERKVLAAE